MEMFTARPVNILGNIVHSSFLTGVPVGIATGVYAIFFDKTITGFFEISKGLIETIVLLPVMCFLCGILLIAPALSILRYFGLGGPAFVYGISFFVSCCFFGLSMQGGFYVLGVAMACSYVFCSRAYNCLDNPPSGI